MEFKDILKSLRKRAKLTQRGLAEKIGITGAAVNHWESGRNLPQIEYVEPLSRILGITYEYLFNVLWPSDASVTLKNKIIEVSDLTVEELNKLGKGKTLYASKIKKLKMIMPLLVQRAPQSWKYIQIPKGCFCDEIQ